MIACAHVTTCCSFTKSQKLWISDLTEQISIPNLQSASFYLTKLTPPMGSPTEIDEHGSFPNPIGRTNEQAPQLQTVQFGVWRNFRIIPSKSLVEIVKPLFPDAIGNYGNLTGKHKLSLNTWTETIIMNHEWSSTSPYAVSYQVLVEAWVVFSRKKKHDVDFSPGNSMRTFHTHALLEVLQGLTLWLWYDPWWPGVVSLIPKSIGSYQVCPVWIPEIFSHQHASKPQKSAHQQNILFSISQKKWAFSNSCKLV